MKTLKQVVSQDERNAKILGTIINAILTVAGGVTVIYGISIWAAHNVKF